MRENNKTIKYRIMTKSFVQQVFANWQKVVREEIKKKKMFPFHIL